MRLFSYIVAHDYGLAPNPYRGKLTLAICKPGIRKSAKCGDWVIGTGSKNVIDANGNKKDHSGRLVFAMKVDKVFSLKEYDEDCHKPNSDLKYKLPHDHLFKKDWKHKVGDNIYDYSNCNNNEPRLRKVIHQEEDKESDLKGENVLISEHFYYFGNSSVQIPIENVADLLKNEQGHLVLENVVPNEKKIINDFLFWLQSEYIENNVYDNPQKYWDLDNLILKKKKCHILKRIFDLDQ